MRALPALLAVLLLASPAGATTGTDRIYTVAGGGDNAVAEGIGAGDARIAPSELTVRDDGTIVFVQRGRLWAVDGDGRLRALPSPDRVLDVDAEPGGSLLAVRGDGLYRLSTGAATWTPLFTAPPAAPPALRAATTEAVTHMPGGRILVGGSYLSWILEADGRVVETIDHGGGRGVAAWPGGGLALVGNGDGLVVRTAKGVLLRPQDRDAGFDDVVSLPDGSLLADGDGMLLRVVRSGGRLHMRPYPHVRWGLGNGDGGPLGRAPVLVAAIARSGAGEIVIADGGAALLRGRFLAEAYAFSPGWLTQAWDDVRPGNLIRVVGPPGTSRALVAITPATYHTIAAGRVNYHSTLAGPAILTVDGLRVRFTAVAGDGHVTLPRRPAPGDHRLTLTIAEGPRTATARFAVSTRPRLRVRLARRLLRDEAESTNYGDAGEGSLGGLGACTVRSPRRLDCGLVMHPYSESEQPGPPYCGGVFSMRQRLDGLRYALLRERPGSHCREPLG